MLKIAVAVIAYRRTRHVLLIGHKIHPLAVVRIVQLQIRSVVMNMVAIQGGSLKQQADIANASVK
jgi:hypothetical protein